VGRRSRSRVIQRDEDASVFGDQASRREYLAHAECLEVVHKDEIGIPAGGDGSLVAQPEALRGVERAHGDGLYRIHPHAYREAQMVVHVAVGNDILNMAVIAAERAAPRVAGRNAGQERSEVLGGGAFAYKDVAAPAKVLAHLLKRGALVGIRNAGDEIGVEIPAKQAWGVSVHNFAVGRTELDFCQYVVVAGDDAGEVHHFADTGHFGVVDELFQFFSGKDRAGILERRRRNTGGEGDKNIERQVSPVFQHVPDAFQSVDVGDFVRIGHDAGSAVREYQPGETRGAHHAGFDMDVGVDEAGQQVGSSRVNDFHRLGMREAEDFASAHADVRFPDFAGQHVHQLRVGNEKVGGAAPARRHIHKVFQIVDVVHAGLRRRKQGQGGRAKKRERFSVFPPNVLPTPKCVF